MKRDFTETRPNHLRVSCLTYAANRQELLRQLVIDTFDRAWWIDVLRVRSAPTRRSMRSSRRAQSSSVHRSFPERGVSRRPRGITLLQFRPSPLGALVARTSRGSFIARELLYGAAVPRAGAARVVPPDARTS